MGKIYPGFPEPLGNFILSNFKVKYFVETGTYLGNTAEWASRKFQKVYTIESSPDIYKNTKERIGNIPNIEFFLGDSAKVLKKILPRIKKGHIVCWLDAHWSGGTTFGKEKECPLLNEIDTINKNTTLAIIVIDDARFFLLPPPVPHKIEEWPSISEIINKLNPQERYIAVWNDVIIAVPKKMKNRFIGYLRKDNQANTKIVAFGFLNMNWLIKIKNKLNFTK